MNLPSSNKALVILSGGQDSTTCLFWAKQRFQEVHAVTFNYGQAHHRELQAAQQVACLADVASHTFTTVGPILKSTSPLVDPQQPLELYQDFQSMDKIIGDRIEKTFVPMRNALFLVLAANLAVHLGCGVLVTGVCQADNANYPDCRADFINAAEGMINQALGLPLIKGISIATPLMNLSKAQSIKMAFEIPGAYEALAFTHTAYDGQYPPKGKDHASVLRAHGFFEAGAPDPLVIRAVMEGQMSLPDTTPYLNEHQINKLGSDIRELKRRLHLDVSNDLREFFPPVNDDQEPEVPEFGCSTLPELQDDPEVGFFAAPAGDEEKDCRDQGA